MIVIINSRFLEHPQKQSRRNQLIHRRLTKTKSIGSGQDPEGPSIKYVMLFLTNFNPPPPVTLCHTFRNPLKYVTHLEPPKNPNDCPASTCTSEPYKEASIKSQL